MRTRWLVQIGVALLVMFACLSADGQSNQEWIALKSKCGLSPGLAYNDWAASGSPCPANRAAPAAPTGPGSAEQLGTALGNVAGDIILQGFHNLFYGTPPPPPDPAQQQRALAAQQNALAARQLNNSGVYLLNQKNYTGAINEFQKALALAPNDANILHNLAAAKQRVKDVAVAAKTSGALSQFLGNAPPVTTGIFGDQLTHSSVANPNASPLSLVNVGSVNLGSDSNVVDLRDANSSSPESLKSQLDGLLSNHAPASAPPDPLVVLPEARDIELLFPPPQSTQSSFPGPQRPANEPKPLNPMDAEEQAKAEVKALFGKPGGLDDVMLQQIQDDAIAGISKPAPAEAAAVLPHN